MPLAAAWVLPFSRGGFASVSREVDSVFGRSVGRSVCGRPEEAKRRGALTLNAISPLLSLKRPDRPRGKKKEEKGHSPGRKGGEDRSEWIQGKEEEEETRKRSPRGFVFGCREGGGGCEQTESVGGGGVEIPPVSCISTLSCWQFEILSFSGKNVVIIGVFQYEER